MKIYNEFCPAAYHQSINLELLSKVITAKALTKAQKKVKGMVERYNRTKYE